MKCQLVSSPHSGQTTRTLGTGRYPRARLEAAVAMPRVARSRRMSPTLERHPSKTATRPGDLLVGRRAGRGGPGESPSCKSQERCSSDLPWRLVVAKAISDSKEVGR